MNLLCSTSTARPRALFRARFRAKFRAGAACALALAALAALPRPAAAQSQIAGAIGGTVTDASRAVIPGAAIAARNLGTGAAAAAVSDANGRYIVPELPPGDYSLEIKFGQFNAFQATGIHVDVNLVTTVNAQMALGPQSQAIEVSGAQPVVDTEQSQEASEIDQTQLDNLPINQRRWSYFTLTAPGVAPDGTYGDVSVRGLPYMFDNNTVDGASNTQQFYGEEVGRTRMAYSTSLESIQEFQVSDSNYSAEIGRSTGAVVNAVTKSGANSLHGSLYYYNRNDTLWGAYDPFSTGPVLTAPGVYATQEIKPLDIRNQFGGDAGGALIKNKLFYYLNIDAMIHHFPIDGVPSSPTNFFQPITVALPASCNSGSGSSTVYATSPASYVNRSLTTGQALACRGFTQAEVNTAYGVIAGLSGTVPRTGDQTIMFPKLDWHPSDADAVTLSYNRVRWTSPYGVQTSSVVSRGIDDGGNDYVHDDRVAANWAWTTPAGINNLRVIADRDFEFEDTTPSLPDEPVSSLGLMPEMDINGCGYAGGGSATSAASLACAWDIGAPYYTQRYALPDEERAELGESFAFVHGNHYIKVGGDISRVDDVVDAYAAEGDMFGEYEYANLQDALSDFITATNGLATPACTSTSGGNTYRIPCYEYYNQSFGPLNFSPVTIDSDAWAQDDWHVRRDLTLNLGLRWDHEALPAPIVPNPLLPQSAAMPGDDKDFGPRLGFNWDVGGKGSTVVRGGFGMYYGMLSTEQLFDALTLAGSNSSQLYPTFYATSSNGTYDSGAPTAGAPAFPNIVSSYTPSGSSKPNVAYLSSGFRLPGAEQFNLTVQQRLSKNMSYTISYIGSIGRFLPMGIDTNLPAPTYLNYSVLGGPAGGEVVSYPFYVGSRPNPNFNTMVDVCSCAISRYNAAVVQFTRHLASGLDFDLNYTFSQASDDGDADSPGITSNTPIAANDLALEYGSSTDNVPNRFTGAIVWQPAAAFQQPVARALLSGWTLSINDTAQTGQAYSAAISGNAPSGTEVGGLGPVTSGVTGGATSTRAWFLPKDGYHMPNIYNTDARLGRTFALGERVRMQLSLEGFNLLNHLNYTAETSTAYDTGGTAAAPTLNYSSSFGALTNGDNSVFFGPRQFQLGAKISF